MSFSSTSKRWESASIDDVAREINRIMGDPKYRSDGKSLHIYTTHARKLLSDLGMVMTFKLRAGNVIENY